MGATSNDDVREREPYRIDERRRTGTLRGWVWEMLEKLWLWEWLEKLSSVGLRGDAYECGVGRHESVDVRVGKRLRSATLRLLSLQWPDSWEMRDGGDITDGSRDRVLASESRRGSTTGLSSSSSGEGWTVTGDDGERRPSAHGSFRR